MKPSKRIEEITESLLKNQREAINILKDTDKALVLIGWKIQAILDYLDEQERTKPQLITEQCLRPDCQHPMPHSHNTYITFGM